MPNILKFRNDTPTRKRLMCPEGFAHPAKMHAGMLMEIGAKYCKPGDVVVDCMAGSGTTMLLARIGMDVLLIEKESHFIEMIEKSWQRVRTFGPEMGYTLGDVTILQGDARRLEGLVADCIVTSPPYEGSEVAQSSDGEANRRFRNGEYKGNALTGMGLSKGYTRKANVEDSENIGNMKGQKYWDAMRVVYQQCHAVLKDAGTLVLVTKGFTRDGSYVDLPGQTKTLVESLGFQMFDEWLRELWSLSFWRILQQRRDPGAFDNRLKYETIQAYRKTGGTGNVDVVLTSPPYANRLADTYVDDDPQRMSYEMGKHNIERGVDCVITSPPYEAAVSSERSGIDESKVDPKNRRPSKRIYQGEYSYTRKGTDA